MTHTQLRTLMDELRLTLDRAAQLCGVDRSTIVRWRSGDIQIHPSAAKLLRLLRRYPEMMKEVERL